MLKTFQNFKPITLDVNYFIYILIFSYVLGPAVFNIVITFFSLVSIYNLFFKKNYYFEDIVFIFILFIALINFIKFSNFNPHFFSFLRLFFIFIAIDISLNYKKINYFPLIFLTLILLIDSLFQFVFGQNLLGYGKFDGFRLTSLFKNEPIIGSFLMKLIIPIIVLYFIKKKLLKNELQNILKFLIPIGCTTIFLSGERMPVIQITFFIIIFFIYLRKFKSLFFFFISSLILLKIINLFDLNILKRISLTFSQFLKFFNTNLFSFNNLSDFTMLKPYILNFGSGFQLWLNNILLGGGYRFYHEKCTEVLKDKNSSFIEGCSTHPHNIPLEILSDFGIIGLILFYLLFFFPILRAFKNKVSLGEDIGFVFVLLVMSFPFFTSQSIFSSYYGGLFFVFLIITKKLSISKN